MEESNGFNYAGLSLLISAIGGVIIAFKEPIVAFFKRLINKQNNGDVCKKNTQKGKMYFWLSKLLNDLETDRIYIIQPHPLDTRDYFSWSYELVNEEKNIIKFLEVNQFKKCEDWAMMIGRISQDPWLWYPDINLIKDRKWRTDLLNRGVVSILYHRLTDDNGNWIGTLVIEYLYKHPSNEAVGWMKDIISQTADIISSIVDVYNPKKKKS